MLKITKDSIFCEHYVEDQLEVHDIIENGCFSNHLNDTVYIEEDVTLKNILEHLDRRCDDVEIMFSSALGGLPLEPFLEEMRFGEKSNKDLKNLYFGRTCEIIEYADNNTELIENLELYSIDADLKEYALEFSPVSYYTDVPIILDDTYEIVKHIPTSTFIKELDGSLKRVYDKRVILKTTKTFTFYEFLHSVLYEITKYGTPEERQEIRVNVFGEGAELEKNEIISENGIQNHIKELERLEKEAVEKEDYEKSATYRDRISELKEKIKRTDGLN